MNRTSVCGVALSLGLSCLVAPAGAAVITSTLGNTTPGYNDGDVPLTFLLNQTGPAPFDTGIGNEVLGPDFSATWTHSYASISDPIVSASFTFGIVDHDSAASGSQLASFTLDGNSFTTTLDALFEASGEGADGQYDIYTVDLSGIVSSLTDGSLTAALSLAGPGLQTAAPFLGGGVSESVYNGANLIFATLQITTRDQGQPGPLPVPPSLALLLLGLAGLGLRHRHATR